MNILKNILQNKPGNKLNFIIVGAQKSGTSALFYYLKQHPEISLGNNKELHFFDNEKLFRRAKPNYRKLHNKINWVKGSKIAGECTPSYMYWAPAMKRIWEYNPEMKIIVILRNPVKRAYSQWNMYKRNGKTTLDFKDYIARESELAHESFPFQSRKFSCIDRGFYSEQLQRIFTYFKKDKVLILKYEYFKENQQESIGKILNFLGVATNLPNFKEEQINVSGYQLEMTAEEEKYLLEVYENEIKAVERMLSWDCKDWKTPTKAAI